MVASKPPGSSDLYLDFSQFNKLRKLSGDDEHAALQASARQMEGIFLNMMLQSMRQANSMFTEGSMFESKESQFYQGMYDKQLVSNIANGNGIGLADIIVNQLASKNSMPALPDQQSYGLTSYLENKIPAVYVRKQGQVTAPTDLTVPNTNAVELEKLDWHSPEEFVEAIYPFAKKAADKLGVGVEAVLAQAVLETGWGKHVMEQQQGVSSHNFFGIKADTRWVGEATRNTTTEYRNGIAAKEEASFRSYQSLDEAFDDYVSFLQNNPRYDSAVGKNIESKQWGYMLQKAGYATDPNYGSKIANIMDSDVLKSVISSNGNNG